MSNTARDEKKVYAPQRRIDYIDQTGELASLVGNWQQPPCEACGCGKGVPVGSRAGRVLYECTWCARRFFLVPQSWRP